MKFKLIRLISLITLVLGVSPLAVFAAFDDVTAGSGVNLGITVGGGQENFTLEGSFETFTVNAGNVSIGVNSGSGGSLVSTTKRNFNFGSGIGGQVTCSATSNSLGMTGTTQVAETVTPLESTCSSSSGGGDGGGGSSGGGTNTTAPSSTSTTATTPTTVVAQATTPTPTPAQPATTPAATVAQPSPVAQLVSPVFNSDLQVGFRSDDVKRLQELLAQDKAIYPDGLATGYY